MAKCSICNSRKGKRKCKVDGSLVCSLCCGQSRNADNCKGCSFYEDVSQSRNYRDVPFYSIKQMSDSIQLQDISYVIESTICEFYSLDKNEFTDKKALQILEFFFDKYHFNDLDLAVRDPSIKIQFERMSQIIEQDLADIPKEQLLKVMASIYRSIQRRTNGGKEYLSFIQQYIGVRVGPGARVLHL